MLWSDGRLTFDSTGRAAAVYQLGRVRAVCVVGTAGIGTRKWTFPCFELERGQFKLRFL